MRARQLRKLGFFRALRERTGMMNEQLPDQVTGQPQERGLLVLPSRTGRAQGFDFDQFEIELVDHRCGLKCVTRALSPHARGRNTPEFGIEKLDEPARGLMVAAAKARHQPSYGRGLEREWTCHSDRRLRRVRKNS